MNNILIEFNFELYKYNCRLISKVHRKYNKDDT